MSPHLLIRTVVLCSALLLCALTRLGGAEPEVDNHHYTHAIAYKSATGDKKTWLQLLRLDESCNLTDRASKPSTAVPIRAEAFKKLWDGIASIQDFKANRVDDPSESLDLSQAHFIVTFQRSKPTGRHESTRMFTIPLGGESKELTEWLASLEKLKGEQGGAGQPATRSESDSEGGDKPQPESGGRSR